MSHRSHRWLSAWFAVALGCRPERPESLPEPSFDPGEGTDTGDDGAMDEGEDPAPGYDLSGGQIDDGGSDDGCQQIDFLFVVDNSSSMAHHQAALLASFGGFMSTIADTVNAQNYHVMVVDSDAGEDIARACEPCGAKGTTCGDWCTAKDGLDLACETALGAGEVAPYNEGASNRDCGVPGGKRYLTAQTPHDALADLFTCMANVGTDGSSNELPLSAMVAAVTDQAAPGGCNEGFVRDDAILVVTVITDDYPVPHATDDANEVGTPDDWYEALVAAKGTADNIVVLGIINTDDALCVSGAGDPITHPTERFVDFVDRFGDRGLVGNVCSDSYAPFFAEAVGIIGTTCEDYVPIP